MTEQERIDALFELYVKVLKRGYTIESCEKHRSGDTYSVYLLSPNAYYAKKPSTSLCYLNPKLT